MEGRHGSLRHATDFRAVTRILRALETKSSSGDVFPLAASLVNHGERQAILSKQVSDWPDPDNIKIAALTLPLRAPQQTGHGPGFRICRDQREWRGARPFGSKP